MSHELCTPLNAIASLSRLLLDRIDGELTPEQAKQIHFVLRSADGLSEMVTELLDLAKIEEGKTEVRIAATAVGEVFSALRGMFRPLALNDRVKLIFSDRLSTFVIRTDQDKLAQILRNLISNALKFTEAGSVAVSARVEEGDRILFAVTDTGIGIAPEHRDTVFEEWGQVASAQRGTHRGSGLGFPLSRRLAELLGGCLRFDSVVGHGATFFLSLPSGVVRVMPEPVSAKSSHRVILIVDDDEVARCVLMKQLRFLTSARLVEAKCGNDTLFEAKKELPELILLSLPMPDMSGEEVLTELHREEPTSGLQVVIRTSNSLEPERKEVLSRRAMDIISRQPESAAEQ